MNFLKFKSFCEQLDEQMGRGFIKGVGMDAPRHERQYITPHIGSKEYTHTLGKEHEGVPAGSKLRLHKSEYLDGKLHVHATDENTKQKHWIPVSKIHKPGELKQNKGFDYEQKFVERLKKHGLMEGDAAGFSSGNDFNLINKKNKTKHKGQVHNESALQGETKLGKTAAFGQLTIAYDKKKGGWHVPEENRKNRPGYAKHIQAKGIIEHMNKHHKPRGLVPGGPKAKIVQFDHDDLEPANSYLKDHHVDVVQVGKHGTYRVGAKDKTGHGLPKMTGQGQWRVRQKTDDPMKRTIQFMVKHADKSHVDLDDDEHLSAMAKTLGHKPLVFRKSEDQ
jgi:hypothetical protein